MAKIKAKLGKWTDKVYWLPNFDGTMQHTKGESLMFFGMELLEGKEVRPFYGIGVVIRVVKGDKRDLVYINFGMRKIGKLRDYYTRLVVVSDNHARRQILTLKRGQICQVYGMSNYYVDKRNIDGENKKVVRLGLYAYGLQGWYVPTMLDIKKMPKNEDLVNPTEWEEEFIEHEEDILDKFLD